MRIRPKSHPWPVREILSWSPMRREQQERSPRLSPSWTNPSLQTKPQRIVMELVGRAAYILASEPKGGGHREKNAPAAGQQRLRPRLSSANSYDTSNPHQYICGKKTPNFSKQYQAHGHDPVLLSVADLQAAGFFKRTRGLRWRSRLRRSVVHGPGGRPLDGNKSRVKGVTSEVLKGRGFIVTGPAGFPAHQVQIDPMKKALSPP